MYSFSVSGYDANNEKFSPCSIRSIKSVLLAKSNFCFEEASSSFCGNMQVEPLKECDAGMIGLLGNDTCCTAKCGFKPGAICSPRNSPCCNDNCHLKPSGVVCKEAAPMTCHKQALCSGLTDKCEDAPPQPDGTECINGGECRNKTCVPFCSKRSIGLKPCICENVSESCYRCCWNGTTCSPYTSDDFPRPMKLPPNTPCIFGICTATGKCKKQERDVIKHIWAIIEKLDVNTFTKFIRNNIVATVIFLSLLVWVPACVIISKIDAQKMEEQKQRKKWQKSDNFIADPGKIRKVPGVKVANSNIYPKSTNV